MKWLGDGDRNTLDVIVVSVGLHALISRLLSTRFPCTWCPARYELRRRRRRKIMRTGLLFIFFWEIQTLGLEAWSKIAYLFLAAAVPNGDFFSLPPSNSTASLPLYKNIWFLFIFIFLVKIRWSQDGLSCENSCILFGSVFPPFISSFPLVILRAACEATAPRAQLCGPAHQRQCWPSHFVYPWPQRHERGNLHVTIINTLLFKERAQVLHFTFSLCPVLCPFHLSIFLIFRFSLCE